MPTEPVEAGDHRMPGDLLLISNSTNPGEGYLDHCADALEEHFASCARIMFVPYALYDLDGYAGLAEERFARIGLTLRSVHRAGDVTSELAQSDGVFVGGGNTFRLLAKVRALGFLDAIRSAVEAGMPYSGASAGSNLACPTIKTTNDMPIVDPGGLQSLDIFPYQINAHYIDRDPDVAHGGETREQRIAEYHEENESPVIGLYEGAMLEHSGGRTTLRGERGGQLFQKGESLRELSAGDVIEEMIA